jgi:hypothetical protein
MTAPACSAEIIERLVIVDAEKKALEFTSVQNLYRAAELLENEGRRFLVVER